MDRNLDSRMGFGKGLVHIDLSFLTNNTSSPLLTTLRGADGSVVASLTRNNTGIITILFTKTVAARYVVSKHVELDDLDAADDGAYATSGPPLNEGAASGTTGLSFKIYTRAAAGTKTDYANRRVNVRLVLKNSNVGV